jgi:hypothetical protein
MQTIAKTCNLTRLTLLMACLKSTKEFFAEWLSLPSRLYYRLPMTIFALVAHAVVVLGMLNFFQCDGWDLESVRQISPFLPILESLAQKYEEASRETDDGEKNGCTPFSREGTKMKRLKEWYEARLPGMQQTAQRNEGIEIFPAIDFEFDELCWTETMDCDALNPEYLLSGVVDAVKL